MRAEVMRQRARYNGLTPAEFGDAVGVSDDKVRELIRDGWFGWTRDENGARVPECQDTRRVGAKNPVYMIHKNAVARWFAERACTGAAA